MARSASSSGAYRIVTVGVSGAGAARGSLFYHDVAAVTSNMFAITWRPFGTHRINKRLSCQLRGARFGFPIARAAIEIVAVVCLMLRHNRRPLPEPAFHIFTDAVAARSTTVKLLRSRLSFTSRLLCRFRIQPCATLNFFTLSTSSG